MKLANNAYGIAILCFLSLIIAAPNAQGSQTELQREKQRVLAYIDKAIRAFESNRPKHYRELGEAERFISTEEHRTKVELNRQQQQVGGHYSISEERESLIDALKDRVAYFSEMKNKYINDYRLFLDSVTSDLGTLKRDAKRLSALSEAERIETSVNRIVREYDRVGHAYYNAVEKDHEFVTRIEGTRLALQQSIERKSARESIEHHKRRIEEKNRFLEEQRKAEEERKKLEEIARKERAEREARIREEREKSQARFEELLSQYNAEIVNDTMAVAALLQNPYAYKGKTIYTTGVYIRNVAPNEAIFMVNPVPGMAPYVQMRTDQNWAADRRTMKCVVRVTGTTIFQQGLLTHEIPQVEEIECIK